MNQQIMAIAKECGLCDEDGDFYGAKPQNYEQFAELIVRDCAGLFEIGWGDKREWVGLEEEEILKCFDSVALGQVEGDCVIDKHVNIFNAIRAIEAKLKEKNI